MVKNKFKQIISYFYNLENFIFHLKNIGKMKVNIYFVKDYGQIF